MKAYQHCAEIVGRLRRGGNISRFEGEAAQLNNLNEDRGQSAGFKNAFYEYSEEHKNQIGSQMNRIYSMSINIYRKLPEIEKAIKEVFSDSFDAEVRQPNMLIVLIHDFIIQGNKLMIGGKLSRMVKDNQDKLRALLGSAKEEDKTAHLPKYAYLRLNSLISKEEHKKYLNADEDSDSDIIDLYRSLLKDQGFKVKRVQGMNILQVKNKGQVTPISQHEIVKTSKCILQDLSSCMPVEILSNAIKLDLDLKKFRNKNKDIKIVGIDSTSSPGNKTLQLAELCHKVYAFERDPKRAGVL